MPLRTHTAGNDEGDCAYCGQRLAKNDRIILDPCQPMGKLRWLHEACFKQELQAFFDRHQEEGLKKLLAAMAKR